MHALTIRPTGVGSLCAGVLLWVLSSAAMAVSQSEVNQLNGQCESARQ